VRHFRHLKHRLVAGERDIASRRNGTAEAERAALHDGDDRDFGVAHRAVTVEYDIAEGAALIGVGVLLRC
jgi:hypothetical protein